MEAQYRYWDFDSIHAEALKYKTRRAFGNGNGSAYGAARRLKVLDQVCSDMEAQLKSWNLDSIHAEALKHKKRSSFKAKSRGAYSAAQRLKIIDQVCSHMPKDAKYKKRSAKNV